MDWWQRGFRETQTRGTLINYHREEFCTATYQKEDIYSGSSTYTKEGGSANISKTHHNTWWLWSMYGINFMFYWNDIYVTRSFLLVHVYGLHVIYFIWWCILWCLYCDICDMHVWCMSVIYDMIWWCMMCWCIMMIYDVLCAVVTCYKMWYIICLGII